MIIQRRLEWIEYPAADPGALLESIGWNPDHGGFKARVFVNPSVAEMRAESHAFDESNGTDTDAQDTYWRLVADRVPEWNLATHGDKGKIIDIAPPAKDWESFLSLPHDLGIWLRLAIHWAYNKRVRAALQGQLVAPVAETGD